MGIDCGGGILSGHPGLNLQVLLPIQAVPQTPPMPITGFPIGFLSPVDKEIESKVGQAGHSGLVHVVCGLANFNRSIYDSHKKILWLSVIRSHNCEVIDFRSGLL